MIDNRDYEKDPQSEQEIESARNNIYPNLSQEDKPKVTQMSSSIRGYNYSDEEKKDIEKEEYRNRKRQIEVREFLTRTFIFKNLMSVKAPDRTFQDSPFLMPGRTRLAESDEDFKEIFDREFLRSVSKENVREIYAESMIEKIEKLTADHLDFTSNEPLKYRNMELINSARRFINFLKVLIAVKPEIEEIIDDSNEMRLKVKALLMVYNGENMKKIHGDKLSYHFAYYNKTTNRIGIPPSYTRKKVENKIDLIEKVIDLLPEEKRKKPKDELIILRSRYDSMD